VPAVMSGTSPDKNAYDSGIILVLAMAAMLGMVNLASLGAFLPVMSRDLNVSVPVLGQVTTATFLGAACIGILAGPLSDLYGKRRLLVLGLVTLALSAAGTWLAPTFGWLLVARLLSSISGGALAGTTLAVAGALFDGAERRRAMSWIASGIAAGAIVGIPFLTVLASLSSWRSAYAVLAGLTFVWIALSRRLLPNDAADGGRLQLDTIVAAYHPLLGDRTMLALNGSTILRASAWVGTLTYVGAYLGDELGLSTSEIGWAYMLGGGGYFLGTKLAGGRLGALDLRTVYGLGTIAMGLLLGLAIALPIGPMAAIAMIAVAAIAGGLGYVALVTLVSSSSPAGQGTTMSLNAAVFQLGAALGGLFGGLLLAIGGYATLGLGLMGFAFLATALVWRPAPRARLRRPRLDVAGD
jgi:MFS transporter, DHA1 family, inner membrane transport protein